MSAPVSAPPCRSARILSFCALLALPLAGCGSLMPGADPAVPFVATPDQAADGRPAPASVTVPARLDNGRLFVELAFRRPDGSVRKALAFVNMGMSGIFLAPGLRAELGTDRRVAFEVGGLPVTVEPQGVIAVTDADIAQIFDPMPVEAMLSAAVLSRYRVTLDYQAPSLTLAPPSDAPADGVPVPIAVNDGTGLASVTATVDGENHPVVIDAGGGYSWWRGSVVRGWLARYPDWSRADCAVGQSNQGMFDQDFEQQGTVVRVPRMELGTLLVEQAGILGSGPAEGGFLSPLLGRLFWHLWSQGAPEPVDGWIGGNVLRNYRLTLDYRHHMSYWQKVAAPATDELNSVGISLFREAGRYVVGGIDRSGHAAPVAGIEIGDELVRIDGVETAGMLHGAVVAALHGKPGEHKTLIIAREGRLITVDTVVNDYER